MQTKKFNPARIKETRRAKGLTAKELAEALGITRSHVTRMELGIRSITPKMAMKIEEVLGIPKEHIHPKLWRI